MTCMAIIKEGPTVGGHLGSAKYREGRQIMGILCKGGHISAAVYKQRSTCHVSQLIGRKRRQENFTIQRLQIPVIYLFISPLISKVI